MNAASPSKAAPRLAFTPVRNRMLQRKCACSGTAGPNAKCEECRKKRLQREFRQSALGIRNDSAVPPVVHVLRSPGHPLDGTTRSFMESRFEYDFSQVRIHTDMAASDSADAIGAKAYSSENDITLGSGHHCLATEEGRGLLAHELVHVLQQRGASVSTPNPLTPCNHAAEAEAHSVSEAIIQGQPVLPIETTAALSPNVASRQFDPRKIYCALHAAVCILLSENPPAAALCWANFAAQCEGAMAATGQPSSGEAQASAAFSGAASEGEGNAV